MFPDTQSSRLIYTKVINVLVRVRSFSLFYILNFKPLTFIRINLSLIIELPNLNQSFSYYFASSTIPDDFLCN